MEGRAHGENGAHLVDGAGDQRVRRGQQAAHGVRDEDDPRGPLVGGRLAGFLAGGVGPPSGEVPVDRSVRFRTLGCYPLTGAVESEATTLAEVIQAMLVATTSERQGRVIDKDGGAASMEKKKQEDYF